ncbi:hypothetical protein CC86DRAFT_292442 [Ophiobolus disseminans]|uniref:Uncharacterized protein n=1 Tax=Ophiobolus disseminans TaxID=1469910 RepID=A0A6A7A018_9PLEO|nr:hypothetical protein CC86DRAFT_292442 [Ophiobolus disseminans]
MFTKVSALAFLAASASAAAIPSEAAPWLWHLTGATSICTAATCRYGFNISAPAGPAGEPSFTATGCIGTSVQGVYKSCAVVGLDVPGDVLSQEFNHGVDIGAGLSVRYTFEKNGIKYTYTGTGPIAHGGAPADLDIIPTEVFATPVEA